MPQKLHIQKDKNINPKISVKRKKHEEQIYSLYNPLFGHIKDATTIIDDKGKITFYNDAFAQLLPNTSLNTEHENFIDILIPNLEPTSIYAADGSSNELVKLNGHAGLYQINLSLIPGYPYFLLTLYPVEKPDSDGDKMFQRVFHQSNDAIAILNKEGQILDCNVKIQELFRGSKKALLGQYIWKLAPEFQSENVETEQRATHLLAETYGGMKPEFYWIHKNFDGEDFQAEVKLSCVQVNGETRLIANLRDVTEQNRIQQTLKLSEAHLKEAQRLANIGYWYMDFAAQKVFGSAETNRILELGTKPNSIPIGDYYSILPPEDALRLKTALAEAQEKQKNKFSFDFQFQNKTGQTIYIHKIIRLVRAANGEILQAHGTIQDVTAQKEAANALRESEEKFRTIFEFAPLGIELFKSDGELLMHNKALTQMLGLTDSRIKDLAELTHPDDLEQDQSLKKQLFAGEINQFQLQKRYIKPDGATVWGNLTVNALTSRDGENSLAIAMLSDITETKKAESALLQSESRIKGLLQGLPDLLFIFSPQGIFLDYHVQKGSMIRFNPETALLKKVEEIFATPFAQQLSRAIKMAVHSGDMQYLYYNYKAEGKQIYKEARVISQEQQVYFISRDITAQIMAERAQKESEDRFRSLFTHMSNALCIIELINNDQNKVTDFKFLEVNKAFEELTSLPVRFFRGNLGSRITGNKRHFWLRFIERIEKKDVAYRDEFYIHEIGKYIEITAYRVDNHQIAAILTDVSERKMAENALMVSEQKFRSLAENRQDAIVRFDNQRRVTYMNQLAEELLECNLYTLLNKPLPTEYWHDSVKADRWDRLLSSVIAEGLSAEIETKHRVQNDKEITMLWRLSPEFSPEDDVFSVLAISRDITRLKQIEQELRVSKEQAVESDNLKSAFLANMSHEIRTPLNGIMGFAELLKLPNITSEEQDEFLTSICNSGYKLLNIINDVLDLSKIEAGQVKIVETLFSVDKMLDELYKLFQPKMVTLVKNVELRISRPATFKPVTVHSDEGRIRQILINLIDNALKFTAEGHVEFGYTLTESNSIRFFVKDTGIGIPKEKQHMVYERFRQAQDSHLNKYGGTGLGLSIAKGFVTLLGGDIWFESTENVGTSFFFMLPCAQEIPESTRQPIPTDLTANYQWGNKKILIVEDDYSNFIFLRKILENTNLSIVHADCGEKAYEAIDQHQFNAILMDVRLPDTDGYTITRTIREQGYDLPILFQSANAMKEDLKKSIEAGGNAYISKPIEIEKLLVTLDKYL